MTLTVNHSTPADGSFSATGATAWNASHTLSGTIDVANGGTGQTTTTAAINALLPTQATNSGKYLTTDGTNTSWATVGGGGGSGTVTTVSVVSANGLAGTVANATTTPAITLSTSITGVLKGNGTAISAATANTDYQSPITLTTTGTSGAATFNGTTLNIPQYTGGGGGTPGGSTTQFQYNNAGAFAGSANLVYDGTNVQVNNQASMRFSNATTNYVAFKAPASMSANTTWTLPGTDGTSGQTIVTNGSGTLTWATPTLTPVAPTNYALPVVSGTATVGQTLSCTTGGWSGYPAPTYAYQWVRGAATNISGATSSTYTLVDADYNNTVKCTVTATNSAGSASATSAATATVAGSVPGAPTIGTAIAGNAQASVAFTAPAVTGGPAITSYTATSSPGGITGSAASSPITVSGLTNGTAYTFTVTATNSIGTGPASAASNSVTPSAAPVTDASFAYVPLLLETTSTNGQQNNTFLDSGTANGGVGFTITRSGTPPQGSITPYWPNGQWSNFFNGSSYLSVASNSVFAFGTGNFTVEAWVFLTANIANTSGGWITDFRVTNTSNFAFGLLGVGGVTRTYTAANTAVQGSGTVTLNTWHHIAYVNNGGTLTTYLNGAVDSTTSTTISQAATALNIAARYTGSELITGYISNLRVVNGVAVYTGVFTPSTTLLTATQSANVNGNPSAAITGTQTSLLTCQSNRFRDSSNQVTPAVITVGAGTPTVQAFQPFSPAAAYTPAAYGGSGYFNGSTDNLSAASNAAFGFGTGDFTIDLWVYVTNTSNAMSLVDLRNGTEITTNPLLYMAVGGAISWLVNGAVQIASAAITANSWVHVAVSRSSASTKIFINGTQSGSTYSDTNNYGQSSAFIGRGSVTTTLYLNGYLSNVRLVKGTAVYTANFTPPTSPVTAITNTSLLLNMTNAGIYDAAVQNNVITVGDAQASTTITAQWPPTSMKFDGTGDWLTAIDNPQLQLGTGDFTIEGWFYLTANGTAYGIVSKGAASTGWSVNVTSGNRIQFSYTAANLTGSTTTLAASTWYYFAVVRSGSATGNLKIYINGTLEVTSGGAVTDNFNQTNILYVGASRTGTTPLNGYLQDIRITKAARPITASPTASFPVQ
jgi:hypothetical protein